MNKAAVELELISCLTSDLRGAPISSPLLGLIQHHRECNHHVFKYHHGQQEQRLPCDPLFLLARIKELLEETFTPGISLGVHVPILQVALKLRDQLDDLDLILPILRSLRKWARKIAGLKEACERVLKGKTEHGRRNNWEWFFKAKDRPQWIACLLEWPCLAKPTVDLITALSDYFLSADADPYKCLKLTELTASLHWRDSTGLDRFIPLLVDRLASDSKLLKPCVALMQACNQFDYNIVDSLSDVTPHMPILLECFREHQTPISDVSKATAILSASEQDPQIIFNVLASLTCPIPVSSAAEVLRPLPTLTRMSIYGELLKRGRKELKNLAESDFAQSITTLHTAEERRRCYAAVLDYIKPSYSTLTQLIEETDDTCRVRLFDAGPALVFSRSTVVPRCLCEVRWYLRHCHDTAILRPWLRYPEGVMWQQSAPCSNMLFDLLATMPTSKWSDSGKGNLQHLHFIFADQPERLPDLDAIMQRLAIKWHCWQVRRTLLLSPLSERPTWMIPAQVSAPIMALTPCQLKRCVARAILGQDPVCSCLPRRFLFGFDQLSIVEQVALVTALHQLKPRISARSGSFGDLRGIFRRLFPSSPLPVVSAKSLQTLNDHIQSAKDADFYLLPNISSFPEWCTAMLSSHPSAAFKEALISKSDGLDDHLFSQFMEQLLLNACFYFDDERIMGAIKRLAGHDRTRLWLEYYDNKVS